ncbi:MAG: hypothetical protein B7Y39_18405 [Bdellovibrio sp. 28-41-41]|nr:MAG: hypothetical protein B7Y39_18405 [Bdellovibrio sp. 28-41-41]
MQKDTSLDSLRKFPRKNYSRLISVLYKGRYYTFESIELSEGGLSFLSDLVLDNGTECIVNLQIPKGDFVSIRGTIRHSSKVNGQINIGLSFDKMAFSNKRQIRSFVAAR